MPQPLLPAEQIARARNIIGKIEKHELSDEQISAIAGAGHNTLVLAGAGTGKTTTIVGYIAWLLNTGTATPEEILVRRGNVEPHHAKHRQSHSRMHIP